jgi:hypothetical protein
LTLKLGLKPKKKIQLAEESVGQRISRIRKERGYTQNELAEHIGTIQALVSDMQGTSYV